MTSGSSWSDAFIHQLAADKELRDAFVADQVRNRIALMVRAIREQAPREWTQKQLGDAAGGKPQSVISRIENPDYGKYNLQTLLEIAAAFDVPLIVDFPEWDDWLRRIKAVRKADLERRSFSSPDLLSQCKPSCTGNVHSLFDRSAKITSATKGNTFEYSRPNEIAL